MLQRKILGVIIFQALLTKRWEYILIDRMLMCRGRVQSVPIRLVACHEIFLICILKHAVHRVVKGCVVRSKLYI
jgi:hypothetical protein